MFKSDGCQKGIRIMIKRVVTDRCEAMSRSQKIPISHSANVTYEKSEVFHGYHGNHHQLPVDIVDI